MSESLLHVIVQGTLLTLVLFSVATWALVLVKGVQAWNVSGQNRSFRKARGNGLPSAQDLTDQAGPELRLTQAALATWEENEELASKNESSAREVLELRLKQQIQREKRLTENGLAVLASIGTTSPFVGLFGTVWGIMGALIQIGATGEAGIEVVAGPIGEALIATGVGIAVAVPAVIAFNVFVRRLKVQVADLEDLAQSLVAFALQGKLKVRAGSGKAEPQSLKSSLTRRSEITEVHGHQEARA